MGSQALQSTLEGAVSRWTICQNAGVIVKILKMYKTTMKQLNTFGWCSQIDWKRKTKKKLFKNAKLLKLNISRIFFKVSVRSLYVLQGCAFMCLRSAVCRFYAHFQIDLNAISQASTKHLLQEQTFFFILWTNTTTAIIFLYVEVRDQLIYC